MSEELSQVAELSAYMIMPISEIASTSGLWFALVRWIERFGLRRLQSRYTWR